LILSKHPLKITQPRIQYIHFFILNYVIIYDEATLVNIGALDSATDLSGGKRHLTRFLCCKFNIFHIYISVLG